ncbi:MAG TPA: hypothetical protein VN364_11930 [Bellilinea sp.]|nr:hypothetical protein [Bellilinea sp.]
MRTKKLRLIGIAAFLGLSLMFGLVSNVFAVHDLGLFELDRNPQESADAGDDWATLNTSGGSADTFTGILPDIGADGGTQFHGGGSKDDLDIPEWLWNPDEPLDKDDITNAYAAAYTSTTDSGVTNVGDTIIYFGMDRFSANGSAQVGFWFLQDPAFGKTNIASQGGFEFSGVHFDNDVLVQSNFTNGGIIENITVYKWLNGGLVNILTVADCLGPPPSATDDVACATVNRDPVASPWPYSPKANEGTAGTFPVAAFFEGGINISRLIPDAGCFTGFLAETRSSTPFDAVLKDFVLGEFDLCSVEVVKTGDSLSKVGDPADYTVTITNTGSIALYKDDISDSLLDAITTDGVDQVNANVVSNTCGASLAAGASCTITLQRTVLAGDPDPLPNTVSITYKGKANLSGIAVADTDDHSVDLFQPAIAVDKTGDTLSKVGDTVDYVITLSNNSSVDTPALTCSANDPMFGNVFSGILPPGDTVVNQSHLVVVADPDPLVNTVTLTCSPAGFPNVLTATDSHSVELFQPSVGIVKTGDTLSKVGDEVTYNFLLTNNSSIDTPALTCVATDNVLGTIFSGVLPLSGATYTTTRVVQAGDPDPLVNTVTMNCTPAGFPNALTATDDHSVDLFQPAVGVVKTGDALSKVGDDVNYVITLTNSSSADTPDMVCTAVDTLLGTVFSGVLAGGDTVLNESYTVQAGDPDPLVNTVTLTCSPAGFPNVLTASDDHTVELFQPAIAVDKTGTVQSKVGDPVDYTITLTNTSSADTPAMECTATDTLLGEVFNGVLALGDTVLNESYTVQAGDPDPLLNTVTLTCSPTGFPNVLTASDDHSTDLFQPAIAVDKTGDTLSKVGDDVNYTITLTNTSEAGSPALNCTAEDSLLGSVFSGVLAVGDTVIQTSRTVQAGDPDPLVNTVTLTCSPEGFPNVLTASDSHETNLFQPAVTVSKTGDALSKVTDPVNYTITLSNTSSADTPAMTCTATDTLLGQVWNAVVPLGDTVINTSRTVQAGDPDPLVNTVNISCGLEGFPNVLTGSASHSTDLFQPAVEVIKTGPATAATGDTVTYHFVINNLSSSGSPDLILDSVTDTVIGSLTAIAAANGCSTLAAGGSCSFDANYTIQAGDPDPLVNVVTVHYHPANFPNDITDTDDHSLDLIALQGCTPGFWQGGAGKQLWNTIPDNKWTYGGDPPFIHTTLFNTFFSDVTDPRLDGMTMMDLVSGGGGSDWAVKAARDMVAAYLNESAFPDEFTADSLAALEADWYAAVTAGDAGLQAFHNEVGDWNDPEDPGFCPLP